MSTADAEQLALDGLAPRKRRKRAPAEHVPASDRPIARVVLDVQATHLGQTFDYLIDERQSDDVRPGVLVRVRFGGRRVNGVVWERADRSDTPASSLRYLERVFGPDVLVPASMREDITLIADAYGGTCANILRLAVPPRVARVEQEQRMVASPVHGRADDEARRGAVDELRRTLTPLYDGLQGLDEALHGGRFRAFALDPLPGAGQWCRLAGWMASTALAAGKAVVIVLPTMREVDDLSRELTALGLRMFERTGASHGGFDGDVAVLNAALPPAERYRAYLAVATGRVRCVIGTRAAMYAPVEGPALFLIYEDIDYQNADGMMPYAHARGVLRLRARSHDGVFVAMANARSPISQWECGANHVAQTPVSGFSTSIRPLQSVVKDRMPWVRWLNREELGRLGDTTVGARVPHTAVTILSKALENGPVLLSIPRDGVNEALSCAACHRRARCPRCTGPLARPQQGVARCLWCGAAAVGWHCPGCGGERMRVVRVGAAGTAQELRGLFRYVPIVTSSPNQPRGIVEDIACTPMIVIATPGAEPRVRGDTPGRSEYRAVAILDAWTSLYETGVDARVDTLTAWMRAVAMCAPRSRGGQALVLGETDPVLARSLALWDGTVLAERELVERAETGLPPAAAAACVWGRRDAVRTALDHIGAFHGDLAVVDTAQGEMPAVWGPVPIAQPRTIDARELEATQDRVKAVVRVPLSKRAELARRLRVEIARHVAAREPGELRFQLDPKDLT
ncbi:primosomal protein N' [Bifidobacterium pullorum]|uniref:primosomal protein N' n=1 Tax=Bifidobacterium pullorum TaxID=78448 RepID=UPI0024313275|nr:primosomal protein N' [Bifidobacterium pullorum]